MGTEALLALLLRVAVGRLCLSMLPPGWPGYHDRRELGATLCASLLLGLLAMALLPIPWVWLLVLLLRVALLPGALRPRHETKRAAGLLWELGFVGLAVAYVTLFPESLWIAVALGLAWLPVGLSTWSRRADRRARALAILGVLTPLALWLL